MIVKLKCVKNGGIRVTDGNIYQALINGYGIYVIVNDIGYFSFIDTDDLYSGEWEVVN